MRSFREVRSDGFEKTTRAALDELELEKVCPGVTTKRDGGGGALLAVARARSILVSAVRSSAS